MSALSPAESAVVARAARRLVPFMALLYFISFLDRVNVGFAALTMNEDIGLSASAYGFGAGIFFIGYFLFEVPSNLLMKKVGARIWIARIMISWGILAAATAFVTGPVSFWIVRFLLGIAEAGFFPGMILYLTFWFPRAVRGRVMAGFLIAVPLSSAIGAPLSTWLLGTSIFGLAGWQSMFLIEAVPASLLGIVVLFMLPNGPQDAKFLSDDERRTLIAVLEREQSEAPHSSLRAGLSSPTVWRYAMIYLGLVAGLYGFSFWAPQMIKSLSGVSNIGVGLLSIAPFALGAAAMRYWGARSDRHGGGAVYLVAPAFLAAAAFVAAAFSSVPAVTLAFFVVTAIGINAALPVFWGRPAALLTGAAAAGGIALINSIGNLGGYIGPFMVGWLHDLTGGYGAGMVALGAGLLMAGLLAGLDSARRTQA
ncbi:MAG: MFS transporter [Sphingobium sp.]|nr:MFS transporter [Sphingobium sp.]